MDKPTMLAEIKASEDFLNRSTRPLAEEHSGFAPKEGMLTAANQLAHVAHTVHWFLDGAFAPEGFALDFEEHDREVRAVTSIGDARKNVEAAFARTVELIDSKSDAEWDAALPQGMIMGGEPRWSVLPAIVEHTAHHRGALTVYSRLQGLTPPMPYMDMPE